MTMSDYMLTFGIRYATEPHPTFSTAHPDGWVTIEAPNEQYARKLAHWIFGPAWAFLYSESTFEQSKHLFPRGEIARIRALVPAPDSETGGQFAKRMRESLTNDTYGIFAANTKHYYCDDDPCHRCQDKRAETPVS
jgi:hypothetical protein